MDIQLNQIPHIWLAVRLDLSLQWGITFGVLTFTILKDMICNVDSVLRFSLNRLVVVSWKVKLMFSGILFFGRYGGKEIAGLWEGSLVGLLLQQYTVVHGGVSTTKNCYVTTVYN